MPDDPTSAAIEVTQTIISSPFVDAELCLASLGADPSDRKAARLYLELPVGARPRLSYFFDRQYYLSCYPDIADAGVDPFVHFIQYGCGENRSPHPLIDLHYMRSIDNYLFSHQPTIAQLNEALAYNLVDPSPYFSVDYYRGERPDSLEFACGMLGHFLTKGLSEGLRPNQFFNPQWYYRQLDGEHDAFSGIRHFVMLGDRQGRSPSLEFCSESYLARNTDVVAAGTPPLLHYLTVGTQEGRQHFPVSISPRVRSLTSDPGLDSLDTREWTEIYSSFKERVRQRRQHQKDAVRPTARKLLECESPLQLAKSLRLPFFKAPKVSILIPAFNEAKFTAECIASIVASAPRATYEVVVADDASDELAAKALSQIEHLVFVRQSKNVGFLRNCNGALASCKGEYLFLLNNDAQLGAGALDSLVAILDGDTSIAAVGPKILYPNGRLQEAGCSVARDGASTMAGLFADPANPAFSFNRDVHYCSGAALLIRKKEIGSSLFDDLFAPAYCEDLDLCLTLLSTGKRVVYCSEAEVIHHLSISTNRQSKRKRLQLVARNQQKLAQKWKLTLDAMNVVRPIAFYLPQYHPTEENNLYWGKGFTEWTNVTKATPAYGGHYQPHLPADLGFYDLRVKQTFHQQAELAKRYGIRGFCVYYYNFGKQRALHQAFEAMVSDRSIEFPFCVCWANESWTRHWDGGSRGVIFEQSFDEATLIEVLEDAVRYASDPRYIRVNGKPLFLVYRPLLIPNVSHFASSCRRHFQESGFRDVHLVYVESMEAAEARPQPKELGFDASVEFPPQGIAVPAVGLTGSTHREGFIGNRYDYESTVIECISRSPPGYRRYPSVFPSWDNTPRQPLRGDSFVKCSPEVFQAYVEEKLDEVIQNFVGDERLLFINAWNEWAEGTHLEPDQKFGHRWLEAIHNAIVLKSLA